MKTISRSYPIRVPTSANDLTLRTVETITVELYPAETEEEEMLTPESSLLIEERRAYHMGRMTGTAIRDLREDKLNLTQDELSELLKCGQKSLSRWENGRGYPSGIVNTILRLLEDGSVTVAALRSVAGPRADHASPRFFENRPKNVIHYRFQNCDEVPDPEIPDQLQQVADL